MLGRCLPAVILDGVDAILDEGDGAQNVSKAIAQHLPNSTEINYAKEWVFVSL